MPPAVNSAPTIAPCSVWPTSSTGRFGARLDTTPPAETRAISTSSTREHARASRVHVRVEAVADGGSGVLHIQVRDDGGGGATVVTMTLPAVRAVTAGARRTGTGGRA